MLHVWIPLFIVLDWLLSPGRAPLSYTALRVVIAYPVAWLGFTLLRGAVTSVYPYPFLDPATAGWGSVAAYIVGLSAVILGIAALAIHYSARRARAVTAASRQPGRVHDAHASKGR